MSNNLKNMPTEAAAERNDRRIIEFPVGDEERAHGVMTEADRLTRLAPDEWLLWYKKSAQTLGIEHETLRVLVEARLKASKAAERAATAEQHRVEDRAERKHKLEQQRIDRDAKDKTKRKDKRLAEITKLPVAMHEAELIKLADRLGLDLDALRDEIAGLVDSDGASAPPSATW